MKTKISKLVLAVALVTNLSTQAQITKGNWMMGGNIGFDYNKYEDKHTNGSGFQVENVDYGVYTVLLEPNIAYFLSNKFAIGTSISYINSFNENQRISQVGLNLSINPFIRFYFLSTEKNYNIFIEPSYYRFISKGLGNTTGFSVKTGFAYFLNSSVAIETALKYSSKNSEYFGNKNINLTIGLQIHLKK